MKRRNLLTSIALVTGGGSLLGTSAFTSVETERTVTVEIADEDEAFLAMEPSGGVNAQFAETGQNRKILFDINDVIDRGQGPSSNAVYTFDNVFEIKNQGTQNIYLEVEFEETGSLDDIGFYAGNNVEKTLDGEDYVAKITTGNTADIGIFLDTSDEGVSRGEDRKITNIRAVITGSAEIDTTDTTVVEDVKVD